MLPRRFLPLMLLPACTLPLNSALRDWARQASFAVARAAPGEDAPQREARGALAAYFYALGVLWDGAPLNFQPAAFAPGATEPAIAALSSALSAASADTPPRWATNEVTSSRPTYEDRRLARLIRAADAPVQQLLLQLKTGAPPGEGAVLSRIGEGHGVLLANAARLSQRETERQIMAARDALSREMRRLPPPAPQLAGANDGPVPASLAAIFPP
ncbi:hypothetical protein KTR66_09540 [Roseococcus sp. SDR]|uniref:hypothetical protein n=1 Tax=Roseococcus sp. SDR TaxID=2835532 RepID=UPI001BD160A6|nr:hypothetical protein [Roseococcus sp. SDR]MBS7790239.1 hypothetical protein [Roseococcus sp. SDR]MBV1845553.1 hypothetical protein [Roseococcus sp. SDR]